MSLRGGRLSSLLVGAALGAQGLACSSSAPVEVVILAVEPEGAAARCERVAVEFEASDSARFSLAHGSRLLALGVTEGRRESVRFSASALDPESRTIRLTLVASDDSRAISAETLALDEENAAPVARPRLVSAPGLGARVALDGSLSNDPDAEALVHEWTLLEPAGGAALEGSSDPTATLILPADPARVTVELTVRDPSGATDRASLVVRSEGAAPNAPPLVEEPLPYVHLPVALDEEVTIPVRASDPEGLPLDVTFSQLAGPTVDLQVDRDAGLARFRAPGYGAMLAFEVRVDDGVDAVTSRVVVTSGDATPDAPPLPALTGPITAPALQPVELVATGTTDPDSEDLWFEWSLRRAPVGSLLGDELLRRLSGPGVDRVAVTPDLPGEYEIELRVADAVGFAPTAVSVTFDARLVARQVHERSVADLACAGSVVAWIGGGGLGVASPDGEQSFRAIPGGAVAYDGSDLWRVEGRSVVRHDLARDLAEEATVELPDGVSRINAIVADPHPSRRGDLYVGTDGGTAILDVSDTTCGSWSGCWVGSPSTGYLHRPPSLAGHSSTDVAVLHADVDEEGVTIVHLGNEYWLARLSRRGEAYDFFQAPIDLFADGEPQAISAIAAADGAVYCGVERFGLVVRRGDRDCGFAPTAPALCDRGGGDGCDIAASSPSPVVVRALAAHGGRIYVATEAAIVELAPESARFARFEPEGDAPEGTIADLEACGGTLFVGTDRGLWSIDLAGGL